MASSSVSQDDIDVDFEKNSRRSRIRTARARQINPVSTSCRIESGATIETATAMGGEEIGAGGPELDPVEVDLNETSPKPLIRAPKEKRPNKLLHNKGKQQRDRRKLREKRRSTGVVHLASTESTGGSTTGDDDESSDAVGLETKRNTQQNEIEDRLFPPHHPSVRVIAARSRDKSPSDLEADDENDHDSLNQSESSCSNVSSVTHIPAMSGLLTSCELNATARTSTTNTPVLRPGTPTGETDDHHMERVLEENKRLLSLMEEKDRRIHLLEFKIQQLMKDTLTISEEQARLQKENSTLLRALSNLTASKEKT